jgi:uncharacterized protein YcbX
MPGTVSDLTIAPVKGMRVLAVDALEIGPAGALGDRAFVVLEADRRLMVTARTPELTQVEADWDPRGTGVLELRFPSGESAAGVPSLDEEVTTELYDGRRLAGRLVAPGPLSDALSIHLGRPARLMAVSPGQIAADDCPVTLMSRASLAAVGESLSAGAALDGRRFRMNVAVDGVEAWEEHGWRGLEVGLGPEVRVRVLDPVPRCVVTTRNPDRGDVDAPVLRALADLRGRDDVTFGVWCQVVVGGCVRRGDAVSVVAGG